MSIAAFVDDLRTMSRMVFHPGRSDDLGERLEAFYSTQADDYDRFRRKLLHGREELFDLLPFEPGATWYDLGAGTGSNLERVGSRVPPLGQITLVDLSPSLLRVAEKRIAGHGWRNVDCVVDDVCGFEAEDGIADIVTFSYSLTMIPAWPAAIRRAVRLLKPGGRLGVVDFFVPHKHAASGRLRLPWMLRTFWRTWFERDNVFLSPDHIALLLDVFETVEFSEHFGRVPYLPRVRVPYYIFIGTKP